MTVDREQIGQTAEALLQYVADGTDNLMTPQMVHLTDARDILAVVSAVPALLAELDQAERERDEFDLDRCRWCDAANEAESRLAKVPAFVEASKVAVKKAKALYDEVQPDAEPDECWAEFEWLHNAIEDWEAE